jgi:hypothetical protein
MPARFYVRGAIGIDWAILAILTIGTINCLAGKARAGDVPASPPTSNLVDTATAELDAANAALADAKAVAQRNVANNPKYQAAKAELDKAAAEKERIQRATSGVTPQQRLDAYTAYNVAKGAVERIESDAVSNDPAVQAAQARVVVAKRTMHLVAPQRETDEARDARIAQLIPKLTPGQLSLAQHLASGGLPDLPADHLEVGSAGQLMLPANVLPNERDRYQVPATVVQVLSKDSALVSMLGQLIWLSNCPTHAMREGESVTVSGCYAVARTQTVQMGAAQRAAAVLEPVDVDRLKEVAAFLQTDAPAVAPTNVPADVPAAPTGTQLPPAKPNGYRTRLFTSVAQIFAVVPYPYQVETSDQMNGLRGEMRNKWLSENVPGAALSSTVKFDSADIGGSFEGHDTFNELGVEHQVTVTADFKEDQAAKLSTFKKGDAIYIRGRIISMSDDGIHLADFTFQRPINPPVDLGGGTIYLGPSRTSATPGRQGNQGGILQQRQNAANEQQ